MWKANIQGGRGITPRYFVDQGEKESKGEVSSRKGEENVWVREKLIERTNTPLSVSPAPHARIIVAIATLARARTRARTHTRVRVRTTRVRA